MWTALRQIYPVSVSADDLIEASGGDVQGLSPEYLEEELRSDAQAAYDEREASLGDEVMRELERRVVLSVVDRKWREHLYEMDYLQEGIGLRAMAQKDPLVEYQREGFELFNAMMEGIKEESVGYLFNVEVEVDAAAGDDRRLRARRRAGARRREDDSDEVPFTTGRPQVTAKGLVPARPLHLEYSAPSVDGEADVVRTEEDFDPVAALPADADRAARRRAERAARKRSK